MNSSPKPNIFTASSKYFVRMKIKIHEYAETIVIATDFMFVGNNSDNIDFGSTANPMLKDAVKMISIIIGRAQNASTLMPFLSIMQYIPRDSPDIAIPAPDIRRKSLRPNLQKYIHTAPLKTFNCQIFVVNGKIIHVL